MPAVLDLSLYQRLTARSVASAVGACALAVGIVLVCGSLVRPDDGPDTLHRRMRHVTAAGLGDRSVAAIVLGNSLPAMGVRAQDLPGPTVNLALGGADYALLEGVFDAASRRFTNLRVVFLQLDELPVLNGSHDDPRYLRKAQGLGSSVVGARGLGPEERWSLLLESIPTLRNLLGGRKWESRLLLAGKAPRTGVPPSGDTDRFRSWVQAPVHRFGNGSWQPGEGAEKMAQYGRNLDRPRARDRDRPHNVAALRRMARTTGSLGARLVLLRPPTTRSFHDARPAWLRGVKDEAERAARAAYAEGWSRERDTPPPPVLLFDDEAAPGFPDADFHDPNHLVDAAAQRYTASLGARWPAVLPEPEATTEP